jgi:hypothetical protein
VEWNVTCPRCGFSGLGRRVLPGSDGLEKLLWYLLVLPGAAYHVWRVLNARTGCSRCEWDGARPTGGP